jgi:hypothetical protein
LVIAKDNKSWRRDREARAPCGRGLRDATRGVAGTFLAGYGAAQAVPGPLFTFAAYLGAVMGPAPNGWLGAGICLIGIFLPSFFLVIGAM